MYSPALQAAGHKGVLKDAGGAIFIKPNTPIRELQVYKAIYEQQQDSSGVDDHSDLKLITWPFMGILTEQELNQNTNEHRETVEKLVKEAERTQDLSKIQQLVKPKSDADKSSERVTIVLGNATHGFTAPSLLDIKLGSILWDEDATPEKRERLEQVSKTTTSGSLNMRIAGMSVYDPKTKERQWLDKTYGREITPDTVVDGFDRFFAPGFDVDMKRAVCEGIVQELMFIREILEAEEMRLISSSLLIVYESDVEAFEKKLAGQAHMPSEADAELRAAGGSTLADTMTKEDDRLGDHDDSSEDDNDDASNDHQTLFNVKLIDLAHTKFTPGQGPDRNVLQGIDNVTNIFQKLERRAALA